MKIEEYPNLPPHITCFSAEKNELEELYKKYNILHRGLTEAALTHFKITVDYTYLVRNFPHNRTHCLIFHKSYLLYELDVSKDAKYNKMLKYNYPTQEHLDNSNLQEIGRHRSFTGFHNACLNLLKENIKSLVYFK